MTPILARGDLPPFGVVLGGLTVLIVAILQSSRRREQLGRLGRNLAARLGGRFESAGLFSNAKILFTLQGRPSVLDFQTGRQPHTHLRVWLPRDPGGSLRISRDSLAQMFITMMDGRRFRVGDRHFDDLFAVRSYPESLGRRIFSPSKRQGAMSAVRRLNHCSGLALEVHPT
ncbi:MAG TPA: hypothetical protein VG457_19670, partial [Planctomycetota bacterium]|nr:hypothetical protein [Planctomycetota bacterium]